MQATEALVESKLEGTGLTVRMRAVMEVLFRHGSLSVPEIATRLHINRQYVQVMVNETIKAQLTRKTPNPRHQRSSLIELTSPGYELIDAAISAEMTVVENLSADLDPVEIAIAHDLVSKLVRKLELGEGIS